MSMCVVKSENPVFLRGFWMGAVCAGLKVAADPKNGRLTLDLGKNYAGNTYILSAYGLMFDHEGVSI